MKTSLRSALATLTLLAAASVGRAQVTVSWGTEAEERLLTNASGTLLPTGSLIWLGNFSAGTDFVGHASDFSYLSGRFTLLGSSLVGAGGFTGVPGAFAASSVTGLLNTPLSYWAFDTALAAFATQWGIFTNTDGLWTTPGSQPNSLNTDLVDANFAAIGSLTDTQARTALVARGPITAVPESSAYAWFATATLTAIFLRRRLSSGTLLNQPHRS